MDNLRYYIDGPGEILITHTSFSLSAPNPDQIIGSSTCKSVTINAGATLEDVTGGRSLFPQRRFPTERTASVEFTDCEMDFRYAQLVSGEEIETKAQIVTAFGSDYTFEVPTSAPYEIELPETPLEGTLIVRFPEEGTVSGPTTTAEAGKPSLAEKKLTFIEADKGRLVEVIFSYTSDAKTRQTSLKVDSLPKTVKVVHKQPTFDNDNNITGYQLIEFFKLQPSPEFNEDYQERAAYAPQITMELVDPKRADKKVYDRTWVPVTAVTVTP